MHAQSDVPTLVASDTATGAGGVVTGVVVTFTAGAGVAVVAFRTGAGVVVGVVVGVAGVAGVAVVVVAPIGTVTAGMEKPANDVLDNTDVGVVADA